MNAIKRNLVAGAISMLGKDNITEMVNLMISAVLEKKKSIPLLEGETEISALLYEVKGEIYFSTVACAETDDQKIFITRFIQIEPASQLIDTILKLV